MRRQLLQALALGSIGLPARATQATPTAVAVGSDRFATVTPARPLIFPRDHGSHPEYRIEWWYLTAWARAEPIALDIGLQITFFRINTGHQRGHSSRFAAKQLMFAHAALAIPGQPGLIMAERVARGGLGLAEAASDDTRLVLDRWQLLRKPDDSYEAIINDSLFSLGIRLQARHAPLLQGEQGFSRKGPDAAQASYYYSRPAMPLEGQLALKPGGVGKPSTSWREPATLRGEAWFDHEWSSELLDARAEGWDWVGLHLTDGSSLMAFRIRDRAGGVLWSDANWVDAAQRPLMAPGQTQTVRFEPLRIWRSPRTGAKWPVAMRLSLGGRSLELQPLLDDQELLTQASTGVTYWEGAVIVLEDGRQVGRGYLELTGYAQALRI